jgi:hypothetical protein
MTYGAMTGDLTLQRYLRDQYWAARDQGLNKRDAHSVAFQEMIAAKEQGYIVDEEPEPQDPYMDVIYKD